MQAENIRINGMFRPLGISGSRIRVTWNDRGKGRQTAFQVVATNAVTGKILSDSGKITGQALSYVLPQPISPQTQVQVMVRLWDENDMENARSKADRNSEIEKKDGSGKDQRPVESSQAVEKNGLDEKYHVEEATATFETAMASGDFTARWISPEEKDPDDKTPHLPAGYLRKRFQLPYKKVGMVNNANSAHGEAADNIATSARLYASAHGLYVVYLNGRRVGDAVLTPGTAEYDKRMPYQTYDVTDLLQEGENEIVAVLGDGWYRSDSGVHGDRFVYGHDLSFLCQLVVTETRIPSDKASQQHTTILISDGTWEAGAGPILQNDMQQGETYDARIAPFQNDPLKSLHAARVEDFPMNTLLPSESVPVKEHERFVIRWPDTLHTPDGSTVLDFGQNLAGYIQLHIPHGIAGAKLRLQCGESLDENGNFTNQNFQEDKKHEGGGILQTITYICKDGVNDYKPSFTIMGFRYAKLEVDLSDAVKLEDARQKAVTSDAGRLEDARQKADTSDVSWLQDIRPDDTNGRINALLADSTFTAIAVYSDINVTAGFTSSHRDLNQLFRNSLWSMKGNFCDIPTDCPTRERAGWTGDAGLFAPTGVKLMDTAPVFRKWLSECRAAQYPDGKIANIAPKTGKPTMFTPMLASSVGWGDACILVPLALYHWTGDIDDLAINYDMMKRWYAFLEKRAAQVPPEKLLLRDPLEKYVIDTGLDYGEWCEPGSTTADMRNPNRAVSTGYFAYSGRLLAQIATILGHEEDAAHFQDVADHAREAYIKYFTENGVVNSTHQADYIRAIRFDLVPEDRKKLNADKLNANVKGNDYHLNTGFLSTPYLCEILADYGYIDTAYRVLLQDTEPSWLYAVKKGATTIWERWNGIDAENKVHASLNHYSYGAISGWLLSGVCGIQLADGQITIRPVLPISGANAGNTRKALRILQTDGKKPASGDSAYCPQPQPADSQQPGSHETKETPPLTRAEGWMDTYCGRIEAGWNYDSGKYHIYACIPDGQTAALILPDGSSQPLLPGRFETIYG